MLLHGWRRREMLWTLAGAPWASRLVRGAEMASLPEATQPAAIQRLQNRRREARPISTAERQARWERARRLMAEHKLDAICATGGATLYYFTGIHWGNSERLFAWILPQKGSPFYVSPAFEEGRAREQVRLAPEGSQARIFLWQEDEDPYRLVAQGLADAGLRTGRLGIEERVPFVFADGMQKAAPQLHLVSATPVTAGCRAVKSEAELALMRLASQITLSVYEAVWRSLTPGMTQQDALRLIDAGYTRCGVAGEATVQVGEYTALPHGSRQPQTIREGTVVMIDDGCAVEGYQSDITRTFVLGKAPEKVKQVFETVHKAQSAALRAARPGLPMGQVDAAARAVITDGRFGPGYRYFSHRLGHGMGLDGHEWPYLVKGNTEVLRPNMTFSDEPGIYIPGEFGVRLEDDMHITENGAELFTPQSPSPEEPFARA